ncbi:MAG: MogA/MoaB family molybdenum cofactor biosynthesis protein [Terriglobia bacterium]
MSSLRVKILVLSDGCFHGKREDVSGPALRDAVRAKGWHALALEVLPDDAAQIREQLTSWCEDGDCDLVLTSGGTGAAPRDVTPEATRAVVEKELPGLAELMRAEGVKKTRRAALSRGIGGVRHGTLIVNLPGSPRGALQSLESVQDLLEHAVDVCQGRTEHKGP